MLPNNPTRRRAEQAAVALAVVAWAAVVPLAAQGTNGAGSAPPPALRSFELANPSILQPTSKPTDGPSSPAKPPKETEIYAGDVFAQRSGASPGGRFSWVAAAGRRPSVAVYAPRRSFQKRRRVVAYRDQFVVREQALFDAESASDRPDFVRNRLPHRRFEIESAIRSPLKPISSGDGSVSAGGALWRGIIASGGSRMTSVTAGDVRARGAEVTGRVLDNMGRGVAGAHVKLGPYTPDAKRTGTCGFRPVPAGDYALSLDRRQLPADFDWDGRREQVKLESGSLEQLNLLAAPLNPVHARVHPDPNGDRRFGQVTATDQNGPHSVPLAALSTNAAGSAPPGVLRTFELAKPPIQPTSTATDGLSSPVKPPKGTDSLRTMVGAGYVQGADWGSELLADGAVAGTQVQLNALVTKGREGLLFDHGSLSVFNPDSRWRIEAGDVFSQLRGASLGGRFSWAAAAGRRPSVAVYAPRRGFLNQRTVVAYRDQIVVRGQTLLDAEYASDRSYFVRNRLSHRRFEIESAFRSQLKPVSSRDGSVSASGSLWRGISVSGGSYRSAYPGDRSRWNTVAVRLPVARFLDLTLERAFGSTQHTSRATSSVMTSVTAGDVRFFHRQQYGEYEFVNSGFANTIQRQQTQSMASYTPGPRVNMALQLATQRADTGQVEHWEELQTTFKVSRTTTFRVVTAVPNLRDTRRLQTYLRQELPGRFAVQADYGRVSAFQTIARELDRSRFKVMLFKTVNIATPARGAEVTGRVLDNTGRGVAGARVKLGPYTADADRTGAYRFGHVPAGDYEVSLDRQLLPADFAWDGRHEQVKLKSGSRVQVNLLVAPLNAVHGRVYADRNANRRFDAGEGVSGCVMQLGEQVTLTDQNGAYSFYNVWPGSYEVRLQRLPEDVEASGERLRPISLFDGAPVTAADFIVVSKSKPIIWESPRR